MADFNATAVQTLAATLQTAAADVTNSDDRTSTVAQTLAAATQLATGGTILQMLHETGVASSLLSEVINAELTEIVLVEDTLFAIVTEDITDTVQASGDPSFDVITNLHEIATGDGAPESVSVTTSFAPKGVEASDSITQFFSSTLTDVVNASEVIQPIISSALHETATVTDEIVLLATLNETLVSVVNASDNISDFIGEQLTSTANASSTITETRSTADYLEDTVTASEVLTGSATAFEELLSSAEVSDLITFNGSVYKETIHDIVEADGYPWAKDFGALAWVLNTETTGLSTYENFQFTSLTEYGGSLYATSPDGVYVLTGDNDEGRRIDATVKTGFLDFEQQQTKRVSDMFVGYTGGQLEFDVETYDGPEEVYTYQMEEREADAPRNNRLKVGRGLSSRYWRFAYRNVDGADFQVYDVTAEVATSKRRL